MIAKKRHTEKTQDGEPIYIIETRDREGNIVPFNGRRERVPFYQGIGRTTSEHKARLFDEVFGYVVYLPKGARAWAKAGDKVGGEVYIPEDETSNYLVDTEFDFIEDEIEIDTDAVLPEEVEEDE